MIRFARLYLALDEAPTAEAKAAALDRYFADSAANPDDSAAADAAWAFHFLTGGIVGPRLSGRTLRNWAVRHLGIPEWLFEACRAETGDLAEALARAAPPPAQPSRLTLHEAVQRWLLPLDRGDPDAQRRLVLEAWAELDADQRIVFNRLVTGRPSPVSATLVIHAAARAAGVEPSIVALRASAPAPHPLTGRQAAGAFRRLTASPAAHEPRAFPFHETTVLEVEPETLGPRGDWLAHWDWDGHRVQLIRLTGRTEMWTADGRLLDVAPDIGAAAQALPVGCVVEGVVAGPCGEHRAARARGRRGATAPAQASLFPEGGAAFLATDLLRCADQDRRRAPLRQRVAELAALLAPRAAHGLRWSAPLEFGWSELRALLATARAGGARGLILKRAGDGYAAQGAAPWLHWTCPPQLVRAVLIGAQRGRGEHADGYDAYTFAVREGAELVPVARVAEGVPTTVRRALDAFARDNTVGRKGAWRELAARQVWELAFDGVAPAGRRRSGVHLRGVRIVRHRPELEAREASTAAELRAMLDMEWRDHAG